jgi:hypothetical protein
MRRDDSVFFFTLVDFLLTALFFGLVWFAVGKAQAGRGEEERRVTAAAMDSIRKATGVSDLVELTDRLTRLGPLSRVEEASRFVTAAGGADKVRNAIATVADAGGVDSVAARLARLQQREGAGLPHCIVDEVNGLKRRVVLATVIGTDSTMTFESETPRLKAVLESLGRDFAEVEHLGFTEFKRAFQGLRSIQPACLYTIEFKERTRFVDARDAARPFFYMIIRHE